MGIDWKFAEKYINLGGSGNQKIPEDDGLRQQYTARTILNDFKKQPGIVLADEVGMGKTYVALAVIASVVNSNKKSGKPVIVMVPSGLISKWQRDWNQFKALCCTPPNAFSWVVDEYAHKPIDFIRLMDSSPRKRPHIIWMTTNCFSFNLTDAWIKLAFIRFAKSRTKLSNSIKNGLYKWATNLVLLKHRKRLDEKNVKWLLSNDPSKWHKYLIKNDYFSEVSEDPIPLQLLEKKKKFDFKDFRVGKEDYPGLKRLMRDGYIPGKHGLVSKEKRKDVRFWINQACQHAYGYWLSKINWHSSLLVLDEAHHAKNDNTRLASLLRSEDTKILVGGGFLVDRPLLWEKFDRMLFLTATPFQLGHHELIRVLRSFAAVKWKGEFKSAGTRSDFLKSMNVLEDRLNENRLFGRRLDKLWGKLVDKVIKFENNKCNLEEAASSWWQHVQRKSENLSSIDNELYLAIKNYLESKKAAESDSQNPWYSIKTWVIRHNRPSKLPMADDNIEKHRRNICPGDAILMSNHSTSIVDSQKLNISGIPLDGERVLPFLLSARAQGELAGGSLQGRAFFAEGLCSSYEAFHHTRDKRCDVRDIDDEGIKQNPNSTIKDKYNSIVPINWYIEQIQKIIPTNKEKEESRYQHPKIYPVVNRVVDLWRSGEKVLLFCFYRETAKALRLHIGREVDNAICDLVTRKLGDGNFKNKNDIRKWFINIAKRLGDVESPFYIALAGALREPIDLHP